VTRLFCYPKIDLNGKNEECLSTEAIERTWQKQKRPIPYEHFALTP